MQKTADILGSAGDHGGARRRTPALSVLLATLLAIAVVATAGCGGGGPTELINRFELIYDGMYRNDPTAQAETDGVVDLKSRAESEAPLALRDDVARLVAVAEEVDRTGNTSLYNQPDVRRAYERVEAQVG